LYPNLLEIESSLEKSLTHYKAITWLPSDDLENTRQASIENIEKLQSYLSSVTEKFPEFLDLL
jgi:hypothetical protein